MTESELGKTEKELPAKELGMTEREIEIAESSQKFDKGGEGDYAKIFKKGAGYS